MSIAALSLCALVLVVPSVGNGDSGSIYHEPAIPAKLVYQAHEDLPNKTLAAKLDAAAKTEKDVDKAAFLKDCRILVDAGLPSLVDAKRSMLAIKDRAPIEVFQLEDGRYMSGSPGFVTLLDGRLPKGSGDPRGLYVSGLGKNLVKVLQGNFKDIDINEVVSTGNTIPTFAWPHNAHYEPGYACARLVRNLRDALLLRREAGDDAAALEDGHLLETLLQNAAVNSAIVAMKERYGKPPDDLPLLMEDLKSRVSHTSTFGVDPKTWRSLPKDQRLAKLISHLGELNAFITSNPGGVWGTSNSITDEFKDVGDDSVDALIECAEKDKRLTRFCWVDTHGMDMPEWTYPVSSVAFAIAGKIAGFEDFGGRETVDSLKEYWKAVDRSSGYYGRLANSLGDPNAGANRWINALQQLTNHHLGAKTLSRDTLSDLSPSISERTEQRIAELVAKASDPNSSEATMLALGLASWDPKAALPSLKLVSEKVKAPSQMGRVFVWRIHLGEPGAVKAYLRWMASPSLSDFSRSYEIDPFAVFPDNPDLVAAAPAIFGPRLDKATPERITGGIPLELRFVRDRLIKRLDDRSKIGTVRRKGSTWVSQGELFRQGAIPKGRESDYIHEDEVSDLLACDAIAQDLSYAGLSDKPISFDEGWNRTKRDAAIARVKKALASNPPQNLPMRRLWYGF